MARRQPSDDEVYETPVIAIPMWYLQVEFNHGDPVIKAFEALIADDRSFIPCGWEIDQTQDAMGGWIRFQSDAPFDVAETERVRQIIEDLDKAIGALKRRPHATP